MKTTTILVLTVVLLLIVGLVLLKTLVLDAETDPPATEDKQALVDADPADIQRVRVQRAGRDTLAFAREGDQWQMTEPLAAKAQKWAVQDIVDKLAGAEPLRSIAPTSEDASTELTGLDKPRWTVTLASADREWTLRVGNYVPLTGQAQTYVQLDGTDGVAVLSENLAELLNPPVSEFRSKNVLDVELADVHQLQLTGPTSLTVVREGTGWRITEPVAALADTTAVEELLRNLTYVTAKKFVADEGELALFGLDDPRIKAVLTVREPVEDPQTQPTTPPTYKQTTHTLLIGGGTATEAFAKLDDAPAIFSLDASLLDKLTPELASLRNRKLLDVTAAAARQITLDVPAGQAEIARQDSGWAMVSPVPGQAEFTAVNRLLSKLTDLQAQRFEDDVQVLARFGLDSPRATITCKLDTGRAVRLLIGTTSPSGEMTFVRPADAVSVAVVKTEDVQALLKAPASYYDATVLRLDASERITAVRLRRPEGTFQLRRLDDLDRWMLDNPDRPAVDRDNAQKLLSRLEFLRASEVVHVGTDVPSQYAAADRQVDVLVVTRRSAQPETPEDAPGVAAGADTIRRELRLDAPGGFAVHRVRAARQGMDTFAWSPAADPQTVGRFAASLWDDLTAELWNRDLLNVDPAKVRTIRISAGTTLELTRTADGWAYPADAYLQIDAGKVNTWLENLTKLKAQRFAAYELTPKQRRQTGLDKPALTVELVRADGQTVRIQVSAGGPAGMGERFAAVSGLDAVAVLSAADVATLTKTREDFQK